MHVCVSLARSVAFSSYVHFSRSTVSFHFSRSLLLSARNSVHFSNFPVRDITVLFASLLVSALTLSQNLQRRCTPMGLSPIIAVLRSHGCYVGRAAAPRCAPPLLPPAAWQRQRLSASLCKISRLALHGRAAPTHFTPLAGHRPLAGPRCGGQGA